MFKTGEVDELKNSQTEEERSAGDAGYTRGVKVDAFKQENELDRALDEAGVIDDASDTTGRSKGGSVLRHDY